MSIKDNRLKNSLINVHYSSKLKPSMCILFVTHRHDTAHACDRVFELEQGVAVAAEKQVAEVSSSV